MSDEKRKDKEREGGRQPGREEVAGARGRARRARARPPGRGGRRQGREAAVGWASGRSWPAGPATGKWPR